MSRYELSGPELASILGLDVRRVTQLAKEGVIPRIRRGVYDLAECTKAYVSYLRNRDNFDEDGIDPRAERARLYKEQADKIEFENQIKRKKYVSIEDVKSLEMQRAKIYTSIVDAIPGRYSALIAAKLNVNQSRIHDILSEISIDVRESTYHGFSAGNFSENS